MGNRVPPGQPTDVTLSRASPAFKAQREFRNQFGTGLPLEQPDMNLAATDEAVLNRQILQRSAKRGRVSGDACYAASTFLQSILERHGIKALNAGLDKLCSGTLRVADPALQEALVALARRCHFITKKVPHEWFDGYLQVEREGGAIDSYGLAIQSSQRYPADTPGNHPGGCARRAMLLPRRAAFKLQASARQLNQHLVYQKLLAVDFLFHNSLYTAVEQALLSRWGSGCATQPPLAMLDLGCGDAQQIAATLARCGAPSGALRLASYTGVDVSPPALAIARRNLAFLQPACSVSFVQHDMTTFVEACPAGQYDLVFASFAVHHLSLEGKASFLRAVARCLRPGGAFVLVDVFTREEEGRAQWLARFRAYMQEAVDTGVIDGEEAATVMGHIEPFDFPEHVSTYQRMAAAAGFAAADCVHTDPKEFSRVMVLRTEGQ